MTSYIAFEHQGAISEYLTNNLYAFEHNAPMIDHQKIELMVRQAAKTIRTLEGTVEHLEKDLQKKNDHILALQSLLTTDELTLINNRRGFLDFFEHEIDRVHRDLSKGGLLIMIDLDNFKSINDTYGHQAGDEALRLVANTLQDYIRKMDCAARLGGDEFVILMANADKALLLDRAQKLAQKLNRLVLKHHGNRISIKASIGMKTYAKGDSMQSILGGADKAMYDNKEERKTKTRM